jgi:hypothetical protein
MDKEILENISFLLRVHAKLQSEVIRLQEIVFNLQSRLYEIEQIQSHEPLTRAEMQEGYDVK